MRDTRKKAATASPFFGIDCTRTFGPEQYFESDATVVVQSPIGRYREAAGKTGARFGYRFTIRRTGRPHEIVIRYPDDKARFMGIMDGTSYDLSTGVITGGELPLSNAMQEVRMVFWPRWTDCAIVFMTWSGNEPAAVASIEVRELDALPALETRGRARFRHGRDFGMVFEDPCGMSCSVGAMNRKEWVDHVASYMRHTGQSLLIYPIAWYHGPQFPSEREPSDAFELVVSPDRHMYGRYTTQPADWVAPLLERFSREGLRFIAEARFMRLGSLMRKMNTDLDAIKAGADTINNLLWNNQVQSGTMDWTVVYNARNYPEMLKRGLSVFVEKGFPYVYGEKGFPDVGGGYPSTIQPPGAIFNPLHPAVQEAAIGFAREIGRRYGKYPAFGGVATNLWPQNFLWFGSLRRGYDDLTVSLFQQETGIRVPVNRLAPDRFSQRYLFLTGNCREEWITWRCHKILGLLCKVRDALREGRRDLPLVLMPARMGAWADQTVGRPVFATMREAGLDLDLLAGEEGIEAAIMLEGGAGSRSATGDLDGCDPTAWTTLRGMPQSGVCIFDSWVESWGASKMVPCDLGDARAKELAVIAGKPAEGLYRFTCEFPPDGFWFEDQWRIATPFASGPHFMAPYAQAVAQSDALYVTRGGLYPDTAHPDAQRRFALAYRALPKKKFETVGTVTDPVAIRTLVYGGRRYLYAVNREYYPVRTTITFSRIPRGLTDLSTGAQIPAASTWMLNLGPYELRSFSVSKEAVPESYKTAIPSGIRKDLLKRAGQALADFERLRLAGRYVSGMDRIETDIRGAMSEGRFAWLRHALAAVRKGEALRRFTPFARTVRISRILPGAGKLETLSFPAERDALRFETRTFDDDFCDVHLGWESDKNDQLIFFASRVECARKMRLAACLGYDGPVKMWIDGQEKFHDPNGMNPANKDAAKVAFTATPGIHEIVVALGSNHGQAWGIYLRAERLDDPRKRPEHNTVNFVEAQENKNDA